MENDFTEIRERFLNYLDAVELTGLSRSTLYRETLGGRLPYRRIGGKRGRVMFSKADLMNLGRVE